MKLESKKLILRKWVIGDVNDLVEGLNNLKVTKWLALVPNPYTEKDAIKWIKFCTDNAMKGKKRNSYEFAIWSKLEKRVIGGISLDNINKLNKTEGIRRKAYKCMADHKIKDECITELLKEEWKKKQLLQNL